MADQSDFFLFEGANGFNWKWKYEWHQIQAGLLLSRGMQIGIEIQRMHDCQWAPFSA